MSDMEKFPSTSEERRKYLHWWFSEVSLTNEVDKYLELFPELDSRLCKFGIGVFLWNNTGKIDIENPDDVSKVRTMLKIIDQTPAYDFFDNTFNDNDPDTVSQILGIAPMNKAEEGEIEFHYSITALRDYERAHFYFEQVSWCIIVSEETFNAYTADGNRFYICENRGWWDTPCVPGTGFPRDRYGYSLIAVEVTPDNKIASITSRWNTFEGDTGNFLSEEELRKILGEENFQKLFEPLSSDL